MPMQRSRHQPRTATICDRWSPLSGICLERRLPALPKLNEGEATVTSRLYLDIDGVLNVGSLRSATPDWKDWQQLAVGPAAVNVSPSMIAAIVALPVGEIVWATTWEEDADRLLAAAAGMLRGLRHVRLLEQWKREAIIDDLRDRPVRRFVWIDDEEAHPDNVAKVESATGATGFGITPHPARGLTRRHVESIRDLLDR